MTAAPATPSPLAGAPLDTESAGWRQFLRYWYGHIASFTGDWFTLLALPLAALAINDDPLFIGVVEFAELVATLVVGMRLGGLADRLPPRLAMIAADVVRAVLVGVVALMFALDAPNALVLVAVAFALGSMRDLHDGAESVMITSVVPPSLLVRANSRFQISDGLGHMLGSLLAGFAATISISLALGVDAISYLLAAVAVWAMGRFAVARSDEPERPEPPWRTAWSEARDENRYWRVLATMCVTNVATVCFMGQFVTFATRDLRLSEWEIGVTFAVMGFGSFAAGIALDRIGSIQPRTIMVAPVVIGLSPIVAGVTRSWAVTLVSFGLVGAVLALGAALVGSMRHASFAPDVQGRVALGSRLGFSSGVLPGVLVAGWLADRMGAAQMYVVFGGVGLCGAVVGLALGVDRMVGLTGAEMFRDDRAPAADPQALDDDRDDTTVIDLRDPRPTVARPAPRPGEEWSDDVVHGVLAEALRSVDRHW